MNPFWTLPTILLCAAILCASAVALARSTRDSKRFSLPNMVLLGALTLGACDAEPVPLPEAKRDYAGTWTGQDMKLTITQSGRVDYERGGTSVQAPIQKFEGDDFTVGAFGLSTSFDVEETPHKGEDGLWQMKVDGVDLVRIDVDELARAVAAQPDE